LGHQTFMTLKETDDEKKIDKQWDILKTKIMQPNLALIFSQVCAVGAPSVRCHAQLVGWSGDALRTRVRTPRAEEERRRDD
jgi:hypothetical protein